MFRIDATKFEWELKNDRWIGTAEASELGLPPGCWPTVIFVKGQFTVRTFHMDTLAHPEAYALANERGHNYSDSAGHVIQIFND